MQNSSSIKTSTSKAITAATLSVLLAACGGGGGNPGTTEKPTGSSSSSNTAPVGATLISTVPRTGVAGTWGYTGPDGNRYAIMGTAKGVLVLDLRDTANPRVVDEIAGPTDTRTAGIYWREMRVYGSYAYIVSEHTNVRGGIMILDLTGLPNSVRYVKSVTPRDGELAAHSLDIDTARGLLYLQRESNNVASGSIPKSPPADPTFVASEKPVHPVGHAGHGSIEIWDIKTDPENPRYLNTFNQNHSVHDMTAVGDFVYVAEGNESGFSIWNVKTPQQPIFVVRWTTIPGNFAHNIWPSGDGSIVVTTEEIPVGLPARVWKLNGSAPPTPLSSFQVGNATPHNVIMEGNMAYLSHYSAGAAVYDLSKPATPRLVAHVDTNLYTGSNLAGCWGVYKFPGQPWMICSDIDQGFKLIRIDAQ